MTAETMLRVLSVDDIRRALPMKDAISAMRTAFSALAQGKVKMPVRAHLEVESPPGTALFMPCHMDEAAAIGIKTVTLFGQNPSCNLPLIQGLFCLFDGKTGTPLAVLNASMLTALRTGAVSGLATDLLARSDATTVAVFGAGVQGRTQLHAVCEVRCIKHAWVFDPNDQAATRFSTEMEAQFGFPVTVARCSAEAVEAADIVCTATVATRPVFEHRDLASGAHVNAVGSYQPDVQELPLETIRQARLVVDHRESALAETGDLLIPIAAGAITAEQIHTELGDIVTGKAVGRRSANELTVFKSVGLAVQDLAAAAKAAENAQQMGLGTIVPI